MIEFIKLFKWGHTTVHAESRQHWLRAERQVVKLWCHAPSLSIYNHGHPVHLLTSPFPIPLMPSSFHRRRRWRRHRPLQRQSSLLLLHSRGLKVELDWQEVPLPLNDKANFHNIAHTFDPTWPQGEKLTWFHWSQAIKLNVAPFTLFILLSMLGNCRNRPA